MAKKMRPVLIREFIDDWHYPGASRDVSERRLLLIKASWVLAAFPPPRSLCGTRRRRKHSARADSSLRCSARPPGNPADLTRHRDTPRTYLRTGRSHYCYADHFADYSAGPCWDRP